MKQIIGMISLCLLVLQTMAQESCIKGKIENYKGRLCAIHSYVSERTNRGHNKGKFGWHV